MLCTSALHIMNLLVHVNVPSRDVDMVVSKVKFTTKFHDDACLFFSRKLRPVEQVFLTVLLRLYVYVHAG